MVVHSIGIINSRHCMLNITKKSRMQYLLNLIISVHNFQGGNDSDDDEEKKQHRYKHHHQRRRDEDDD